MKKLVRISSPALPALVAVAGERASMRFLEFFAANIRNPHLASLLLGCTRIPGLVRECWCAIDRHRPAGARRHLDRNIQARSVS